MCHDLCQASDMVCGNCVFINNSLELKTEIVYMLPVPAITGLHDKASKKVKVVSDQEMAQSERTSHYKILGGKNLIDNQVLIL